MISALLRITGKENHPVSVIGTRHGEKLYEALCSREEMFSAIDQGSYYRIPADNRDLNYAKYQDEGERNLSTVEDYNSHNTDRLNIDEMTALLHKLDFISQIAAGSTFVPEGV